MNKKLNRNSSARTKADSDKKPIVTTSATILPNPMLCVRQSLTTECQYDLPISIIQEDGSVVATSYTQKNIRELLMVYYPELYTALPLSFRQQKTRK